MHGRSLPAPLPTGPPEREYDAREQGGEWELGILALSLTMDDHTLFGLSYVAWHYLSNPAVTSYNTSASAWTPPVPRPILGIGESKFLS